MRSVQGLGLTELLKVLDDPRSVPDLRRYFGVGLSPGSLPPFTGGHFDRLDGGGDSSAFRDVITTHDLIAIWMLSVQVPARVVLDLLEGDLGRAVTAELSQIPTNVDLGEGPAAEYIADGGPADRAWRLLTNCEGVGWVTAGKLLARKRPRLLPVYDDVVRCAFRAPDRFWLWLHGRLREENGVLAQRLEDRRADAELSRKISRLRIMDVVVWMRHLEEHTRYGCPGLQL